MKNYVVEEVAREIYRAAPNLGPWSWAEAAPSHREDATTMARAALERMAELGILKRR